VAAKKLLQLMLITVFLWDYTGLFHLLGLITIHYEKSRQPNHLRWQSTILSTFLGRGKAEHHTTWQSTLAGCKIQFLKVNKIQR
jgi:hypothetical protein